MPDEEHMAAEGATEEAATPLKEDQDLQKVSASWPGFVETDVPFGWDLNRLLGDEREAKQLELQRAGVVERQRSANRVLARRNDN